MKYDVIISILVWDSPVYVKNLLHSLFLNQSNKYSSKIIVLDQGSDQETKSVLYSFKDSIHIVELSHNVGFSKGHNMIFKIASGSYEFEYFCCINSDILIEEVFWLDGLIFEFDRNTNAGIIGPSALSIDKSGYCYYAKDNNFDIIAGSLFLTKRSIIEQCGLFDEIFTPAYFEDTDLNLRYKKFGFKLIHYPILHKHNYISSIPKTAIDKKSELMKEYGNFIKKNQKVFLLRWTWSGYQRKGIRCRFSVIMNLIQYFTLQGFEKMKIAIYQLAKKVNLIK